MTYRAILEGNQVRWLDEVPSSDQPVEVHITLLRPLPRMTPEERRRRISEALQKLAEMNAFADITDPVEWQREIRKDRPLPGREG